MKYLLYILIALVFYSCNQTVDNDPNLTASTNTEKQFEDYFKDYTSDSISVRVEDYALERSFTEEECIPFEYMGVLLDFIPQVQDSCTGAKPLWKMNLEDNKYFLILVQQDNNGPVYYGLTFDKNQNKVIGSLRIAELCGDEGESQTTMSYINITSNGIRIRKEIEICRYNFEQEGDKTDVACEDSTLIETIK